MKRLAPFLVAALLCLLARPALAETPEDQVQTLNDRAMDAFTNLDIEGANHMLHRALRIAKHARVKGRLLAQTYMNLGVVAASGEKNRRSAFEFFKAALHADPTIRPDPATSTPEVEDAFELAKGSYETETGKPLPPPRPSQSTAPLPSPTPEATPAEGQEQEAPPGMASGSGQQTESAGAQGVQEKAAPRGFIDVGFTLGIASVDSGKPADPQPTNYSPTNPEYGSYVQPHTGHCTGNDYCVRVEQPGVLPTFGLSMAAGYYVLRRFALAATARVGFLGGSSTLSHLMLGARAQYAFKPPSAQGIELAGFLGASVGQIQARPSQGNYSRPYVKSGLGSLQLGMLIGYHFLPQLALQATPVINVLFPNTMLAVDLSIGLELAL